VITEVECLSGEHVVGGGVATVEGAGIAIAESAPNNPTAPTGWKVAAVNASEPTAPGGTVQAYVVCAQ
jgi:hypothetical protein